MWVLIFIMHLGEGTEDVSRDIYIPPQIPIYDTKEECHDEMRVIHKGLKRSSLKWETRNKEDRLMLVSEDNDTIWKCVLIKEGSDPIPLNKK